MNQSVEIRFRDLLKAAMTPRGLSQHDLAFQMNVSQTAISLVGSHSRPVTEKMAGGFSRVLGGSPQFWVEAYGDYKANRAKSIEHYLDQLEGGYTVGQNLGTGVRRLLNDEMIELFWKSDSQKRECLIQGFDPRRVKPSSYYTRLGYLDDDRGEASKPLRSALEIGAGKSVKVRTLEAFHLPLWLEAQFHPASKMAEKGLTVEHGPSIDPGFDRGPLRVTVRNVLDEPVLWDLTWPFLKLHFLAFDRSAKSDAELADLIDLDAVTDEEIFRKATEELY